MSTTTRIPLETVGLKKSRRMAAALGVFVCAVLITFVYGYQKIKTLEIRVDSDEAAIQEQGKFNQTLQVKLNDVQENLSDVHDGIDKLQTSISGLNGGIVVLQASVNNFQSDLTKTNSDLRTISKNVDAANSSIKGIRNILNTYPTSRSGPIKVRYR